MKESPPRRCATAVAAAPPLRWRGFSWENLPVAVVMRSESERAVSRRSQIGCSKLLQEGFQFLTTLTLSGDKLGFRQKLKVDRDIFQGPFRGS